MCVCETDLNQIIARNNLLLTSSHSLGLNGNLALNIVNEKYLPQKNKSAKLRKIH